MSAATNHSLGSSRLFYGLPERIIDQLDTIAIRRKYEKDERIFSQGDEGDSLYCVISGRVRIDAVGSAGQEVFLNYMVPGDSFGEIAVVDGLPRTAGASATEPTLLLAVHGSALRKLMNEESELAIHLLGLFCERIRWTTSLYEDSAFLNAPARMAKRVLSLATLHGRTVEDGLELRISQSELARFLGTSRQLVNQYLQDWREQGWVEVTRARVFVRDVASLRLLAAGLNAKRNIVS